MGGGYVGGWGVGGWVGSWLGRPRVLRLRFWPECKSLRGSSMSGIRQPSAITLGLLRAF